MNREKNHESSFVIGGRLWIFPAIIKKNRFIYVKREFFCVILPFPFYHPSSVLWKMNTYTLEFTICSHGQRFAHPTVSRTRVTDQPCCFLGSWKYHQQTPYASNSTPFLQYFQIDDTKTSTSWTKKETGSVSMIYHRIIWLTLWSAVQSSWI